MSNNQSIKGHLDGLVLAVLASEPSHGYAVIEALENRSGGAFVLPEGTVYPALHRLEKSGLLQSSWSDDSSRKRRVYALTDKGHAALAEERKSWESFNEAVETVWKGVAWPATT